MDDINIILASSSKRRIELLKIITDNFKVIPSNIDETVPNNIENFKIAEYLAEKKALKVNKNQKNDLVLGCDTIVIIDNRVLGKPSNRQDAYSMLKTLSGRIHNVVTGCCIIYNGHRKIFHETTKVEFYNLTDDEIDNYILSEEPFDKAGSYAIQGKGALLIKKIDGDYYNVVGLPISRINKEICYIKNLNK